MAPTAAEVIDQLRELFEQAGEPSPAFEALLWQAYVYDWLGADGEASVLEACRIRGWVWRQAPIPVGELAWDPVEGCCRTTWTMPRAFETTAAREARGAADDDTWAAAR